MTGKLFRRKKKDENAGEPVRLKLPLCSVVFFIIFGVSAAILGVCFLSSDFADFFCRRVASGPRALLAWITAVLPLFLDRNTASGERLADLLLHRLGRVRCVYGGVLIRG